MKIKTLNQIEEFLSTLKTSHTDISDFVNANDLTDFDNVFDQITDILQGNNALSVDIIYYYNAMEYLSNNDTSLNESLQIASELSYKVENLNSEVLASLLASENNREEWAEKEQEIEDFFAELKKENEG